MAIELPRFCLLGTRPVKAFHTADGGVDVVAFDRDSGQLVRDMTLAQRVFGSDSELQVVTEEEFEQALERLRES